MSSMIRRWSKRRLLGANDKEHISKDRLGPLVDVEVNTSGIDDGILLQSDDIRVNTSSSSAKLQSPPSSRNLRIPPSLVCGTRGLNVVCESSSGNQALVDIVLLHGLTGDALDTWADHEAGVYWPADILGHAVPDARILVFGYDADVAKFFGSVSTNGLREHGMDLLSDLATIRLKDGSENRKIIFLAHSLGGLVTKKAICLSRISKELHLKRVYECTIAVGFFGTPHRGSKLAEYGHAIASILKATGKRVNKDIVGALIPNSEALTEIEDSFATLLRDKGPDFQVTCFHEELAVPGIGLIVPKLSARIPGYTDLSIHANHMEMVRFRTPDDQGFARILGELERWLHNIRKDHQAVQERTKAEEECLRSLHYPDLASRLDVVDPASPGTFEWVWNNAHCCFSDWMHAKNGNQMLWIQGKPGSGKSTFLKYLTENLLDSNKNPYIRASISKSLRPILVSHFFQFNGTDLSGSREGLMRSIIWQMLMQDNAAFPQVLKLYEDIKATESSVVWRLRTLQAALTEALCSLKKEVYIFVDALDEFYGSDEDITKFCLSLYTNNPDNLRLCVSSRAQPHFRHHFRKCYTMILEHYTASDIKHYVTSTLQDPIEEGSGYENLVSTVWQKSNGMFLWVKLVSDELLRGWTRAEEVQHLKEKVNQMPKGLLPLYTRMIEEMDESDRFEVYKLLTITTCAVRSLTLTEFRFILEQASDPPRSFSQPIEKRIQALCSGLLEIRNGYVYFSHETVRSFVHVGLTNFGNHGPRYIERGGHAYLLKPCLAMLRRIAGFDSALGIFKIEDALFNVKIPSKRSIEDDDSQSRKSRFYDGAELSFAQYAILHWEKHARHCLSENYETDSDMGNPSISGIFQWVIRAKKSLNDTSNVSGPWMSNTQYLLWRELYAGLRDEIDPDHFLSKEYLMRDLLELAVLRNINRSVLIRPEDMEKMTYSIDLSYKLKSSVALKAGSSSILHLRSYFGTREMNYLIYTPSAMDEDFVFDPFTTATGLVKLHLDNKQSSETLELDRRFFQFASSHTDHIGDYVGLKMRLPYGFPCTESGFDELKRLVSHNATIDKGEHLENPGTIAQCAALHTFTSLLERLLLNGADSNHECARSLYGTPLLAAICGLSKASEKRDAGTIDGFAPQANLIRMLLSWGADPNLASTGTAIGLRTPLEAAVRVYQEHATRLGFGLMAHKAVILLLRHWGAKPDRMTRAIANRHSHTRRLIYDLSDTEGRTLLETSDAIMKSLNTARKQAPRFIHSTFGNTPATITGGLRSTRLDDLVGYTSGFHTTR